MARNVLLIEPDYKNKYPPIGLMKLSTYYKNFGDKVQFYKGDLLDFVANMLCDDLIKILKAIKPKINWLKHTLYLRKFIRYGKLSDLPDTKEFTNSDVMDNIYYFRDKYKKKSYFKNPKFDIVCITTLFTFNWSITIKTINFVKQLCKEQSNVYVGGIAATIVPDYIEKETNIRPITGLLDKPGILDKGNKFIIDKLPLDYSILHEINYKYTATDAYFAYTTRGCVNKCSFCAVPLIEPQYNGFISLKNQIRTVTNEYGKQRNLLLLDNNTLASPKFDEIVDEIKSCGFKKDSTYLPPNPYNIAIKNLRKKINDKAYIKVCIELYEQLLLKLKKISINKNSSIYFDLYKEICNVNCDQLHTATKKSILNLNSIIAPLYEKYMYHPSARQRYVDFNQGIDARLITPQKMRKLSEINIRPLRVAFDNWQMKETYETAIRLAAKAGITNMSNYMLYNFNDKPIDLYNRMALTIDLCEELNIAIYSFPMKYHPVKDPKYFKNREYIGKYWCRKYIRAIQAVLTSTHGKIGRGKQFFEAAFGRNSKEYEEILLMPEVLIINRFQHDEAMRKRYPEKCTQEFKLRTTDKWRELFYNLNSNEKKLAVDIICKNKFTDSDISCNNKAVKTVLKYYQIQRDNK